MADICQKITDSIVRSLEIGVANWQRLIVDDLDMIISFVAKMLVVMLVGCVLAVAWTLLFPHRRTVGETDKKPPDRGVN